MYSKRTTRLLNTIAIILILLGVMLMYLRSSIDFSVITEPFEQISQALTQDLNGSEDTDSETAAAEAAEQKQKEAEKEEAREAREEQVEEIKEKTGLTKAQEYYIRFATFIEKMERKITELPNKGLIVLALWVLFTIKSFVAIVPVSFTCLLTAVIFPFWLAIPLNIVGVSIIFTIRYYRGQRKETNSLRNIINRIGNLNGLLEDSKDGTERGNPRVLFALRLIPSIPINPVSQLYGHMKFPFVKYLVLSNLGYIFKLVAFTAVGANIDDPFSGAFLIPVIFILLFSGFGILITNIIVSYLKKNRQLDQDIEWMTVGRYSTPYGAAPDVFAPDVRSGTLRPPDVHAGSVRVPEWERQDAVNSNSRLAIKGDRQNNKE